MWREIRQKFQTALLEQRADQWLVDESKNKTEVGVKWRSAKDLREMSDWLDLKVDEEENGDNKGAIFIFGEGDL